LDFGEEFETTTATALKNILEAKNDYDDSFAKEGEKETFENEDNASMNIIVFGITGAVLSIIVLTVLTVIFLKRRNNATQKRDKTQVFEQL